VEQKKVSNQIKRHLIWIFFTLCFFLIIAIFGYTGIALFILIFIPFWGIFSILSGIRFLKHGEWYLIPFFLSYKFYFGNERAIAWMSILCGIGVIALWVGVIILVMGSG
jgi:hypothetical protein